MNLKKIVAREGLIILSIILLSVLLNFISVNVNKPIRILPLDDWEISPKEESDAINKIYEFRKKYPEYNKMTNIELAEAMSKKHQDWLPIFEVVKKIDAESRQKNYKFNYAKSRPATFSPKILSEKLSGLANVILIWAYPLYLIGRFVKWAVSALRK